MGASIFTSLICGLGLAADDTHEQCAKLCPLASKTRSSKLQAWLGAVMFARNPSAWEAEAVSASGRERPKSKHHLSLPRKTGTLVAFKDGFLEEVAFIRTLDAAAAAKQKAPGSAQFSLSGLQGKLVHADQGGAFLETYLHGGGVETENPREARAAPSTSTQFPWHCPHECGTETCTVPVPAPI